MRVSDLLETTVVDTNGRTLGRVRDVHIVQDGPLHATGLAGFRVHGLVAGRFALGTRLGYVGRPGIAPTSETRGPLPLRALFRWLHRNANYVPWQNITDIAEDQITVRPNGAP